MASVLDDRAVALDLNPREAAEPVTFARRSSGLVSKVAADRRRHKRVALTLLGRFMRENRQEYPCRLVDISVGGATLNAPVVLGAGERVIAYFDTLGGLEGKVERVFDGGFGLSLLATPHRREKLAANLTYLINRAHLGELDVRADAQERPRNAAQALTLAEGITITCHVIDFSLSGASIATPARPEIGAEIKLGAVRCKVVRHHGEGIGVQFVDVQHANALRRYFG
jgi:hypothetical protein